MANKHITYKTEGTCSQFIDIDIDEQGVIVDAIGKVDTKNHTAQLLTE